MYPCQLCPKTFSTGNILNRHVLEAHGTSKRKHVCGECGFAFRRKEYLKKHESNGKCLAAKTALCWNAANLSTDSTSAPESDDREGGESHLSENQVGTGSMKPYGSEVGCGKCSSEDETSQSPAVYDRESESEETLTSDYSNRSLNVDQYSVTDDEEEEEEEIAAEVEKEEGHGSDSYNSVEEEKSLSCESNSEESSLHSENSDRTEDQLGEGSEEESATASCSELMFWGPVVDRFQLNWEFWDTKNLLGYHCSWLAKLLKADSQRQIELLQRASHSQIDSLCEISKNLLRGFVPLTDRNRRKFIKFVTTLRVLASTAYSHARKRRSLLHARSHFLPLLIKHATPELVGCLIR